MKKGLTLYFITGADAILEILTWKNPDRNNQIFTKFIAATRPGYDISKIEDLRKNLFEVMRADAKRAYFFNGDSCTGHFINRYKGKNKTNRPIKYLMPERVVNIF